MADYVKVTFPKLNGSNYAAWKFRMMTLLEREEVWDVIDESKAEEGDDEFVVILTHPLFGSLLCRVRLVELGVEYRAEVRSAIIVFLTRVE